MLDLLTHQNTANAIKPTKLFSDGGYAGSTIMPLASERIWHGGQIVAVVLAETLEAVHRLNVTYAVERPSAGFDSPGTTTVAAKDASSNYEDPAVGDVGAFDSAPVKVDRHYATPTQHHNPIELFTTSCVWSGDRLTVWGGSQNVTGLKNGLAEQLGIDPEKNPRGLALYWRGFRFARVADPAHGIDCGRRAQDQPACQAGRYP